MQGAGSPAGLHKSLLLALHAHRLSMSQTTLTVGSESSGRTESVLPGGTLCLANGVATTCRSVSHLQATRSAFRKIRGGTYHQHHQSQCNLSRGVWGNLLATYPVLLGRPQVAPGLQACQATISCQTVTDCQIHRKRIQSRLRRFLLFRRTLENQTDLNS